MIDKVKENIKEELLSIIKDMKTKVARDDLPALTKTEKIINQSVIPNTKQNYQYAAYFLFLLTSGFKRMTEEEKKQLHNFDNKFSSLPDTEKEQSKPSEKNRPPSGS